jgi:hypothetical protein
MTLVLDAGALIALERSDRSMWRRLKASLLQESVPVTHGGIVGQVWRGRGPRESLLAKALEAPPIPTTSSRWPGRLEGTWRSSTSEGLPPALGAPT